MKSKDDRKRHIPLDFRTITHFHPLYGEGRDWVTPVESIIRTRFQEVIPYYNLSSTDTRDDGLGPIIEEQSGTFPIKTKKSSFIESVQENEISYYKETMYDLYV